jgi:hypothetical protein
MSWLEKIVGEVVKSLPAAAVIDRTFGFGDIQRVISLVEKAAEQNAAETIEAGHSVALKAAADPSHSFIKRPVFAPLGAELWKAKVTFPRILRGALLVAIYSYTEFLLRQWCESLSDNLSLPKSFTKRLKGESVLQGYMNYLRQEAKFDLADFATWSEWERMDAYRRARNCLVHNGGIVEDLEDRLKIDALPKIEIDESGLQLREPIIHLLPGACEAAADTAKAFIGRVVSVAARDDRWDGPK